MEKQQQQHAHHHILAIPYPAQGHINPLLQFCKRLAASTTNLKLTLVVTKFAAKSFTSTTVTNVTIDTISDGCDEAGFAEAKDIPDYLTRFKTHGSRTLDELIQHHASPGNLPITCVVYDPFIPWVVDVAKVRYGISIAAFFTQSCTVSYIYYCITKQLQMPVGLIPEMKTEDMPSFIQIPGSYPAYFELLINQFSNIEKADCVLVNTFYELEDKIVDSMSKLCPILPIGPSIPSFYLDDNNNIKDDKTYGLDLYHDSGSTFTTEWLNSKPNKSVVYISFGSLSNLQREQLDEISWAVRESSYNFLIVIRPNDKPKLSQDFIKEVESNNTKYLLVDWCHQLEVLAHGVIGCFITHGGWNSTLEAVCLGVPMVVLPQWTDQPTDAKLVEDVWKVGFRAKPGVVKEEGIGIIRREEIVKCVTQVMEGEKSEEIRVNAEKWKYEAKKVVSAGGSSRRNIDAFLRKCVG